MDWEEAVSAWSVTLRAAGRAGTTIATRTDHIRRVGRALGGSPWDVTGDDLLGYVGGQAWARAILSERQVFAGHLLLLGEGSGLYRVVAC